MAIGAPCTESVSNNRSNTAPGPYMSTLVLPSRCTGIGFQSMGTV